MVAADLKNMDVDALLTLRADVERALGERARELEGQLARVGGAPGKKRGRPAGGAMRSSTLKGTKVPPKYRGPGGETWAGRGAKPRWLTALLSDGHSLEEFSVGSAGSKVAPTAAKKLVAKRGRRPTGKKGVRKRG